MRIAILGAGNVGGALGKAWARKGHAIAYGVPNPSDPKHRPVAEAAGGAKLGTVADAVRDAEVIVLAVPFGAAGDALAACGDLTSRVVIDATNPLRMGPNGLELSMGLTSSGGEHVASLAKGAAVFKTLNQIGFEGMAEAQVLEPPEAFRRAYGLVGRGLYALSGPESKEMGELHTAIYASLPAAQRDRLGDYIDRARSRYATTPEEDRQMSQLMKSAVLSLPAERRARLQSLFEKAMTVGLEKP